ncbi:putative acetyl-CoA synthetase [Gordonia alkanivorans NBRC 16433]|uniref:Putative acetyl-CoA synthetase n=1 Tax=Gordonia alkanivorans NBRC 16433 TaxID=1027371 RepID=F9VYN0_9ACTN|nr:putative acetyl-CoA synthetase [Gordonia alkanivorans NBRC 16433]
MFHGLRVTPVRGLSVTPFHPNSGVVTLPSITAPASRSRATAGGVGIPGHLVRLDHQRAAQRRPATGEQQILDTDRHPVERPQRRARPETLGGVPGGGERRFRVDEAEWVDGRVDPVDEVEQFDGHRLWRQLTGPVGVGQFDRAEPAGRFRHAPPHLSHLVDC